MKRTILITGASGYLGSAISVDLSRDHRVVGVYRREPTAAQQAAACQARWEKGEVADADCLDWIFKRCKAKGAPIDYVIHFAAFTHYGEHWRDEYDDTNVIGTRNIVEAASHHGDVRRILFAGSIAATHPPAPGTILTEGTPAGGRVAYPKSKALGEQCLMQNAHRVPVVILRIGGVFSDWCELPPLFSLITLWSQPFVGRVMPGRGEAGFPYIHREDLVAAVRRIVEKDAALKPLETLLAAHPGCTRQKELFPVVRRLAGKRFSTEPIHIPPALARIGLHAKWRVNNLLRKPTYERPWMLDYVDCPLVVDTSYTEERLGWRPDPGKHILKRLPVLMHFFTNRRKEWFERNIRRNNQEYLFQVGAC
jgi:nucleoside-diphosphate-sugar epimerase